MATNYSSIRLNPFFSRSAENIGLQRPESLNMTTIASLLSQYSNFNTIVSAPSTIARPVPLRAYAVQDTQESP